MEVNGESYHAEGIIPGATFDDNLFRQNEILRDGYKLIRVSYNMLQSPQWRSIVMESLRTFFATHAPSLLGESPIRPNPLQADALQALDFYRSTKGWRKGIVVLPTGTGKTILSALDAKRMDGRALYLVHRIDILKQSIEAYRKVWPTMSVGVLTGEVRENQSACDVLFASKDTLRQAKELTRFKPEEFSYVVVDEVHHGQAPSYSEILAYFRPRFMLGMTATPDRLDRKDIFELFDYNKVFEVSLQEAIEDGYLVPYTYYGLLDDIDYSKIRYQNNRYRVDDLERYLIIPQRNEAILREYIQKGERDKAIGFCVSVKHAERMAAFFDQRGIPAAAITSETPDRDEKVQAFRENRIAVAFTVDLFNEGIDFPNVRVLMFLRPTESKTVFLQQLGRGLRLCLGKDRVRILDFIGNYRRANQVRKWLAKSSRAAVQIEGGKRRKKLEYTYSTGCEVRFHAMVEEILDRQDEAELEVTKDDLKDAYFALAEMLGRKPSREDIEKEGQYKLALYTHLFGSWRSFLQEIGEYTEASYHFPQGVHLGHLLAILEVLGTDRRSRTAFDDKYIKLRGGFADGRVGAYQRQLKYKLLAAMELGLMVDDRKLRADEVYVPALTPAGRELYNVLKPLLERLDLKFHHDGGGVPSTRMALDDREYNKIIYDFISKHPKARSLFRLMFIKMPAIIHMLLFLYQIGRKTEMERSEIYGEFFSAPFVKQYCDQEGIEEATDEAARRRCPFLLNILEAVGIVELDTLRVLVKKFLIAAPIVRSHRRESMEEADKRARNVRDAWPDKENTLDVGDLSILRELFGRSFLTRDYYLKEAEYIDLK